MSTGKPLNESALAEYSALLGVSRARLKIAVEAAESLQEPELEVLKKLTQAARQTSRSFEARREMSEGLCEALQNLWGETDEPDKLGAADEPLSVKEAAAISLWADTDARLNRARLLADCVSAAEAAERTDRSRQAIERLRRQGSLLSLRSGRQWRYPQWQFDLDGPRGLLPGLDEIISSLHLSPYGAALWLTTPKPELNGETPITALRKRQTDKVLGLAKDQGYAP